MPWYLRVTGAFLDFLAGEFPGVEVDDEADPRRYEWMLPM
jgi:hypothetical protein